MSRRLQTAAVALLGLWLAGAEQRPLKAEEPNRYNVLFIAVDDLRPELGCYGVQAGQSPNLDRLARSAMVFNRHYVQVATCGASMYALLTGRSPVNTGVTSGNSSFAAGGAMLARQTQPGAQSLPELFRRSGYHTTCIGKISHAPDGRIDETNGVGPGPPELPGAWDEFATPFGPWKYGWGAFFAYAGGHHRRDGKHRDLMEFVVEQDEDLPDGLMADAAMEQLRQRQASGERFFLALGFFKPHLPLVAPRGDWEAIDPAAVPENPAAEKIASPYWHASSEFYQYNFPFEKSRPLARPDQQQTRRAYLACVRYVDRQIGRVLGELDRLGLADNTVVVVWGDHGWHLGEEQIWGKHSPLERAMRSVLMIRAPGKTAVGKQTQALAETLDLYPTLIDLCQPKFRETRYPLDGKSLLPVLKDPQASVRPAAISYWRNAVSVRTPTHRLVARVRQGNLDQVELYAAEEFPNSHENLAAQEPARVAEMKRFIPKKLLPQSEGSP